MKFLKNILAVFLSLLAVISILPQAVIADSACTFYVQNCTASAGDTFTVEIKVKNNPGFNALTLTLKYDESKFEMVGNPVNKIPGFAMNAAKNIVWSNASNYTNDGTICTVQFKAKKGVTPGDYKFELIFRSAANANIQAVNAVTNNGTVSLRCAHKNVISVPEISPTCNSKGKKAHSKCNDCGALLLGGKEVSDTELTIDIASNKHTWDAGVVTKPATGLSDGIKTYTCTTCGKTKTEDIPADQSFGDVNGDNKLDETDLNLIINHIKGKSYLNTRQQKAADVNCDGAVDIRDFNILFNAIPEDKNAPSLRAVVSNEKGKITVSWNNVGAASYRIYVAESNSTTYKYCGTYTGTQATVSVFGSGSDSSPFTSGKTYKIRVVRSDYKNYGTILHALSACSPLSVTVK